MFGKLLLVLCFTLGSYFEVLSQNENSINYNSNRPFLGERNNELGLFWQTPIINISGVMRNDIIALQYMRRHNNKKGLRLALGYSGSTIDDYFTNPHSRQDTTFYQHITHQSNLLFLSAGLETQKQLIGGIYITAIVDIYYNSGVTVRKVQDIIRYTDSSNTTNISRKLNSLQRLPLTGIGIRPSLGLKWYLNRFAVSIEANACDIGYNLTDKMIDIKALGPIINYRFGLSYRF